MRYSGNCCCAIGFSPSPNKSQTGYADQFAVPKPLPHPRPILPPITELDHFIDIGTRLVAPDPLQHAGSPELIQRHIGGPTPDQVALPNQTAVANQGGDIPDFGPPVGPLVIVVW